MATALVVGNVIGMGIFVLPASLAPFGTLALVGWVITIAGMMALARVFARLAMAFPRADGPYTYIRRTLGATPAFLAAWCYWVSMWVTTGALAVGVVGYVNAVLPASAAIPPAILALGLIWVFVGVNVLGIRAGGGVQIATTLIKLVPMALVIGLGAALLVVDPGVYSAPPESPAPTFATLTAAATIALYAMLGVESAAVPAGRVRDPARTIPNATMAGTLVCATIYLIVSAIPLFTLPQAELAASSAPFAVLLDRFLGDGWGRVLAVFVVVSGIGALNGWTLLLGELTRTLAAHGVIPRALATLNARQAPARALLATAVLASAMVLMNYSKSLVQGFTFLTLVSSAATLPLYFLSALALVVLARRGERPAPDLVVLGLVGAAYAAFATVGLGREPFVWGLALAAAGLPLWLLTRRPRASAKPAQ
jgi:APA family basic amino acid/polyamine antiporter